MVENKEKYIMDSQYYDGKTHYIIKRLKDNGKYKLLFGGLTYKKAKNYLDNPEKIEIENKKLNIHGIFIGLIFLLSITVLYFYYL